MPIHDISMTISPSLPRFPGDPPVRVEPATSIARGDPANVSSLTLSSHCGTHLDAPCHFDNEGMSVDMLPLELLMGKALVADLRGLAQIGKEVLSRLPLAGVERLLLRTDNSLLWKLAGFQEEFVHLTEEAAHYLLESQVRLVGIDYLSIESFDGDGSVHRLLLGKGIVILEGLNLDDVDQGEYELLCLPIKIEGGDGAPVRAVLRPLPLLAIDAVFAANTGE